jgi:glycosyltransferase involved in cell wall biosynthesis
MKFCFVCPNYLNTPFGGIDRITVNNARALAARGHDVHVVVTHCNRPSDGRDGTVYVHERPLREFRGLGRWFPGLGLSSSLGRALSELHRMHGFNVVEVPNWEGLGLVPALARKLPVVIRHHTSMEDSLHAQQRKISWQEQFVFWMERTSARFAKMNLVHSEHHQNKLAQGMPHLRTMMIRHALPPATDRHHQGPQGSEGEEEEKVILSVGALTPRKGIDTLLQAAHRALPWIEGWKVVLVGHDRNGVYEKKELAESDPAMRGRIRFAGFLDDESLQRAYETCGIYVTASVFESFGLTCVEAMRLQKPVVACRAGALPELVDHGRTGLLVSPGNAEELANALVTLAQDPLLRREMGRCALEKASVLLDMNPICDRYEGLATDLANQKK